MRYKTRFIVAGLGEFPIDMLRYEHAYPASEHDASTITALFRAGVRRSRMSATASDTAPQLRDGEHSVALIKYHLTKEVQLEAGRWESFLWRIIEVQDPVRL
jgi:hypothetical protein